MYITATELAERQKASVKALAFIFSRLLEFNLDLIMNSLGCCEAKAKTTPCSVVDEVVPYMTWCKTNCHDEDDVKAYRQYWATYVEPMIAENQKRKRREDPMRYEQNVAYAVAAPTVAQDSDLTKARRYLKNRIEEVYEIKKQELQKQFGLVDDEAPHSFNEFLKRIQDGKYVYPEDRMDKDRGSFWSILDYLRWRDPSVKEDQAGFDAAKVTLKAARQDAFDVIAVSPEADGLAALKDFQSKTFH